MAVTIEEYKKLKQKVEKLRSKRDQAKGRHEAAVKDLAELGFDSVEDAEQEVERLEAKETKLQRQYDRKMAEFEEEFGEMLGDGV